MSQNDAAERLGRTPLFDRHVALGAKIVPFAGFEMPVQYSGVLDEHRAVRTAAGIFDVSHMGEFDIRGPDAARFLDALVPTRIASLPEGKAAYTGLLTERGTFVDDILVYRLAAEHFQVVVNASNIAKDWAHVVANRGSFDVALENVSDTTALVAIQGPRSLEIVAGLAAGFDARLVKYYNLARGTVAGRPVIAARTGYTGEVGYELFASNDDIGAIWDALVAAGAVPAGLGARDTLRLEAAMPLYGNDIDDTTTVLEAGLDWIVDWAKDSFNGREALVTQRERGLSRVRAGFEVRGKGIARHGNVVVVDGVPVGEVCSGTWAPFLEKAIGMAYLPPSRSAAGTRFDIDVRGRTLPAEVVPLPFYKRPKRSA